MATIKFEESVMPEAAFGPLISHLISHVNVTPIIGNELQMFQSDNQEVDNILKAHCGFPLEGHIELQAVLDRARLITINDLKFTSVESISEFNLKIAELTTKVYNLSISTKIIHCPSAGINEDLSMHQQWKQANNISV